MWRGLRRFWISLRAKASQVSSILTAQQSASSALQTSLKNDYTSLQTAIAGNATGTIDQVTTSIGTLNGQSLAIRSKAAAAIYALLTGAQQTKAATAAVYAIAAAKPPRPRFNRK
jgi:hypothetical protein